MIPGSAIWAVLHLAELTLGLHPVNRLAGRDGERMAQECKTSKTGCKSSCCCLLPMSTARTFLSSSRKGSCNDHLHSVIAMID